MTEPNANYVQVCSCGTASEPTCPIHGKPQASTTTTTSSQPNASGPDAPEFSLLRRNCKHVWFTEMVNLLRTCRKCGYQELSPSATWTR